MSQRELLSRLLLEEIEEEEFLIEELLVEQGNANEHPLFTSRPEEGFFEILVNRHLIHDDKKFREFFRLNIDQFNYILQLIENDITVDSSNRHPYPITAAEKLALTLRFMSTGESYHSLQFAFRISASYISKIVKSTLRVLKEKLSPIFLPSIKCDELKGKAEEFGQKWHFPNCVGAIDGKHVRVFCPKRSGSLYYNYKNFFSIVLLAVVDANYKFIFTDVGSYGKEGDSGIFDKSNLGKLYRNGNLFPPPCKLPNSSVVLPHVFVGDEAFRLHTNMMKPYSRPVASVDNRKAIFNYRLSRARRVSENAFGLLSQVFRIFYTPIAIKPETTDDLIVVACCLHNLLRDAYLEKQGNPYYELDPNEQPPTKSFLPLSRTGGFSNADGFAVRDLFMEYFNSNAGTIAWQESHTTRTN